MSNILLIRWSGLSIYSRMAFVLRSGVVAICVFCTFILGYPPAKAQHQTPHPFITSESVVSHEDETQDLSISRFEEFQRNQEGWNKQTGDQIGKQHDDIETVKTLSQANATAISHIDGVMAGGLGLITIFTFAAMIFQLKKRELPVHGE